MAVYRDIEVQGKRQNKLILHFPKQRIFSFGVSPYEPNTAIVQLRWSIGFAISGFSDKSPLQTVKKLLEPALKVSSEPCFHPDNYSSYLMHESLGHHKEKKHNRQQSHKPADHNEMIDEMVMHDKKVDHGPHHSKQVGQVRARLVAEHNRHVLGKSPASRELFEVLVNYSENKSSELKSCFRVSNTYPEEILFFQNSRFAADKLKAVKEYHSKARIPALCYVWPCPSDPSRVSSLWRTSQIQMGVFNRKCNEDIELLEKIGEVSFNEGKAFVFDCRPKVNAVGNWLKGKGYYDSKTYNISKVEFGDIDNIHVVREYFTEMLLAVKKADGIGPICKWFGFLGSILKGAKTVADKILKGDSVIVNCSDGWDRTPQIISLSKILLDPYFRTVEGLRVLISFEWNGFGHKFKSRQAYVGNHEASPVFIQFLDCLHQLLLASPNRFEYNDELLQTLARARIENLFIEFNFDTTEQYIEYMKTHADRPKHQQPCSIWSLIEGSLVRYVNKDFELREATAAGVEESGSLEAYFASRKYDFERDPYLRLPRVAELDIWACVYNSFGEKHHRA